MARSVHYVDCHPVAWAPVYSEGFDMHNRNVQNGLLLAALLAVLFGLMFASSLALSAAPIGF